MRNIKFLCLHFLLNLLINEYNVKQNDKQIIDSRKYSKNNKTRNIMAIMTPLLLILAVFSNLQGIRGASLTTNTIPKQYCDYDAFISSQPIDGIVFLHPWETADKKGDWYKARAFCAKHCAEFVRIDSKPQNDLFLAFMRDIGMKAPGVWLGGEVENKVFTKWSNGDTAQFLNSGGSYSGPGHKCLSANRGLTTANVWYDDLCTDATFFIACQRNVTWSICE